MRVDFCIFKKTFRDPQIILSLCNVVIDFKLSWLNKYSLNPKLITFLKKELLTLILLSTRVNSVMSVFHDQKIWVICSWIGQVYRSLSYNSARTRIKHKKFLENKFYQKTFRRWFCIPIFFAFNFAQDWRLDLKLF